MNSPINKELFTETPCRSLDELLRYRDGTLTMEERHRVEEHLLDCPLCSDALEGLQRVQSTVTIDEIRAAINQPEQIKGLPPFGKYIAIAASLSAIALLSWFAYHQFNSVGTERLAVHSEGDKSAETTIAPSTEVPPVPFDTIATTVVEERKQDKLSIVEEQPKPQPIPKQAAEIQSDLTVAMNEVKDEEMGVSEVEETRAMAEGDAEMNKPVSVAAGAVYMNEQKLAVIYLHGLKVVSYDYGIAPQAEKSNAAQRQKSTNKRDVAPSATISDQPATDYTALIGPPLLLYKQGQYNDAVTGFDRILKNHPSDHNAQFYRAMCYHHLLDYNRSINLLTPVANDPNNPFMEDAMFYLAQSYANTGNRTPAINLYNNIIQNNNNFRKQAKEELRRIEGGK